MWVFPLSAVCFGGPKHGSPFLYRIRAVEGECKGWTGNHTDDETVIVKAAAMFGVECMSFRGCPEESFATGDIESGLFDLFEDGRYVWLVGADGGFDQCEG